ncbi:MAG: hypothetical protein HFE77_04295 [Clostridiales bacterium]|nr:hypothetical protein [Clostridiales bacterium]
MMSKEQAIERPQFCAFCEHAVCIADRENVLCKHKGVVNKEYRCRHFSYDLLKRIPTPPAQLFIPDANELKL